MKVTTVSTEEPNFKSITIGVKVTFESMEEVINFMDDYNGRFDPESEEIREIITEIGTKLENL